MPTQLSLHPQAAAFLTFLQRYRQDRGALASLRCGFSSARRHRAWPLLGGFSGGTAIGDRNFELVAALWAETAANGPPAPPHDLGSTLRDLAAKHTSFEGRFQRLLVAGRAEAPELVVPLVRTAQAGGRAVNHASLLSDLIWWGEHVQVRWARSFWGPEPGDQLPEGEDQTMDPPPPSRRRGSMTFLTQGLIDFATTERLQLRDVYAWHQLVWQAFPERDGQPRDFLTRLDRRERDGEFRLLLLAPRPPVRPSAWPTEDRAWQTREIAPAFLGCQHYRFQLRANPTRRDNASRKRLPLRTDAELGTWLERKAGDGGFVIDLATLRVMQEGREWFTQQNSGHQGFHHSVNFEGQLRVTHRDRFVTAFNGGIGSAKAFGFGLLALVPSAAPAPPEVSCR